MPLDNINYGAGQDLVSEVYDKCNDTIDVVNTLENTTLHAVPYQASPTPFDIDWTTGLINSSSISYNTGWTGSTTTRIYIGGLVEINGDFTITSGGTTSVGTLGAAYIPSVNKKFVIADYNGSDGASVLMILNIATDGTITIFKQSDGTKPANRNSLVFTVNYNIL